ncbi:hypothetical protein RB195_005377 [Necator americanus]|uniref:Uncharacterized protein n=1 Tax=Necator americanus TaxID=51031 RepID=A0ABR1BP33_NECAM
MEARMIKHKDKTISSIRSLNDLLNDLGKKQLLTRKHSFVQVASNTAGTAKLFDISEAQLAISIKVKALEEVIRLIKEQINPYHC